MYIILIFLAVLGLEPQSPKQSQLVVLVSLSFLYYAPYFRPHLRLWWQMTLFICASTYHTNASLILKITYLFFFYG